MHLRRPKVLPRTPLRGHVSQFTKLPWSTRTPTPIVLDTDIFFRKFPFTPEGLDLFTASTRAFRFWASASIVNEARPIVHWTMPVLSARYWIWPALAFLIAPARSWVTVPTLGLGMS